MGGNSIKVGGNFTLGDLHQFAAATRGETGTAVKLKGKLVEKNGVKTLELYASKNDSGFWGSLFNPKRTIKKQMLANEALHLALTNSYGEKVANAVFANMGDRLYAEGGHLNHQLLADVELEASRLAAVQRQPKQTGQQPGPVSLADSAPPPFPRRDSIPEKYHRDVIPADDEDDDDNIYGPGTGQPQYVDPASVERYLADDDDDEDLYDAPDLPPVPTHPINVSANETDAPKADPVLELPDPPAHKIRHTLDDLALQSDSSLEARLARVQSGRPRSPSAPSNNRVQGMLYADRLRQRPEEFSALLKQARAKAGSDLLGDGGFHGLSGADRFKAEAAIADRFAKELRPISQMSAEERHDLAVEAVAAFINLPDPSAKAVDQ